MAINDFIPSRTPHAGLDDVESDTVAANLRWGDDRWLTVKYGDAQLVQESTRQ